MMDVTLHAACRATCTPTCSGANHAHPVLQGEYMKDQMGLENLSHHLLPLLRYRRKKFRAQMGSFPPELTHAPKAL